jgi:poly-gamma-glutamate capsule biosynthesis protein CapA/YwtB (metallophosphatase superfamily)
MVSVIIGGDIYPAGKNLTLFQAGDAEGIFSDLLFEFINAELTIVNLECPLISRESPINKDGPLLGAESKCINGLINAGVDVVSLANNHIFDHGPAGLRNTLEICADAGISTVGAGKNLKDARRMAVYQINGTKIGILAVTEHEFSIAKVDSYGANPYDTIDFVRNIKQSREYFDYLIVIYHGGVEYYPYPSPRLKDTCHFMAEMGADAVIVQHSHYSGCYEKYLGSHLIYGQGNLIFDLPRKDRSFYEGFLVKLTIRNNSESQIEFLPYNQSLDSIGARRMDLQAEEFFLNEFKERSLAIEDDSFVKEQWLRYCRSKRKDYLYKIFGHNYFFKKMIQMNIFLKYLCTKNSIQKLQNAIRCESHREVIETIFDDKMYL